MTTQRVVRRIGRSSGLSGAISAVAAGQQAKREQAKTIIEERLQSLANLHAQAAEIADKIAADESVVMATMRENKMGVYTHAMLKAEVKQTFTNEKKEVDPRTLFNHKNMPREHYFDCVKVQIGELGKFLSDTEIRSIAKITEPVATGYTLKVTPVKPTISKDSKTTRTRK